MSHVVNISNYTFFVFIEIVFAIRDYTFLDSILYLNNAPPEKKGIVK